MDLEGRRRRAGRREAQGAGRHREDLVGAAVRGEAGVGGGRHGAGGERGDREPPVDEGDRRGGGGHVHAEDGDPGKTCHAGAL
ncbi:hypothetical protein [Frankia sp. ArI3]|uniref:hypothetical protein n=1 Tax=Frankia sp. ArI3 TaxID=1858 RepID=UPI002106ED3C|nr:hypothetical protein [Frankia sp. ArI3]